MTSSERSIFGFGNYEGRGPGMPWGVHGGRSNRAALDAAEGREAIGTPWRFAFPATS